MPITVLPDVVMPNNVIAAGVRGKNMRFNSRVPTDNGYESINIAWTQTLRQYELGIAPMGVAQWQAIEALHEITEGGAYGFLIEDPKDSSVADGAGVVLESGGGYQLYKRYSHAGSGRTKDRKITRPRAFGFVLLVEDVPVGSGGYTLNVETGHLTILSDPDPEDVSWTGKFYVPVHFVDDSIDWELVTGGAADSRFLAGPSVLLQEVRE
jgi:uncharacterized protein (TIGR02217 family)